MAAITTVLAGIGLAGSALSAYQQMEAREDAAEAASRNFALNQQAAEEQATISRDIAAQQRARAVLEQRRADVSNVRSLRAAVRQARIARAAVVNTGANAGTSGSSGVLGGTGSIGAQLASNLGFFGQIENINSKVLATQEAESLGTVALGDVSRRVAVGEGQYRADVARADADAALGGSVKALGGTVFDAAGGFKTIFGA